MGCRVGRVSSRAVSSRSRWPAGCGFRGVFWVGHNFIGFFSFLMRQGRGSEATEGRFLHLGKKASSYRGAYRVPLFILSVGMCVRVCDIEFVLFTNCDSCTRPIFTNLVSM